MMVLIMVGQLFEGINHGLDEQIIEGINHDFCLITPGDHELGD